MSAKITIVELSLISTTGSHSDCDRFRTRCKINAYARLAMAMFLYKITETKWRPFHYRELSITLPGCGQLGISRAVLFLSVFVYRTYLFPAKYL